MVNSYSFCHYVMQKNVSGLTCKFMTPSLIVGFDKEHWVAVSLLNGSHMSNTTYQVHRIYSSFYTEAKSAAFLVSH